MATTKGENGLPLPRSLATRAAIRRELIQVYRQTKGGLLPPEMTGRLVHLLSILAGLTSQERPPTRAEREDERRKAEISRALDRQTDDILASAVGVPVIKRSSARKAACR